MSCATEACGPARAPSVDVPLRQGKQGSDRASGWNLPAGHSSQHGSLPSQSVAFAASNAASKIINAVTIIDYGEKERQSCSARGMCAWDVASDACSRTKQEAHAGSGAGARRRDRVLSPGW